MKFPNVQAAGFFIETANGGVLNESRFFSSLSYQDVLNFEMMSTTMERGKIKIAEVEQYLAKYRPLEVSN